MRVFSTYLFPNYSTVENFIPIGTSSYRVKKSTVEKMWKIVTLKLSNLMNSELIFLR
jgi:hypothetical protein